MSIRMRWMRPRHLTLFIALTMAVGSTRGLAQEGPTPSTHTVIADPPRPLAAGLPELAQAVRRFERAYQPETLNADSIEHANRAFDGAASDFFRGRYRDAVAKVDALTAGLLDGGSLKDVPEFIALLSLGLEAEPMHIVRGDSAKAQLRLASLYPAPAAVRGRSFPAQVRFARRDAEPTIVWKELIDLPVSEAGVIDVTIVLDPAELHIKSFATLDVELILEREPRMPVTPGWVTVSPQPFSDFRAAVEEALDRAPGEKSTEVMIARSRSGVLADRVARSDLSRWVLDRAAIARDLGSEAASLSVGRNPYYLYHGDFWAELPVKDSLLPSRWYVPTAAAKGEPLPVVIALHGAGGNEHMFFEAYGAGRLTELAERHGFIAVSPLTYSLLADQTLFPALLDVIDSTIAPIDRSRITMLGHSLGAMTTMGIAGQYGDLLAGVVPIAGNGRMMFDATTLPCRAYAAEHDFVLAASAVRAGVERIRKAQPNARIEFELVKGTGHVLIVNQVLEEAVEWLLNQRRPVAE